jgi:hypothetical protein
MESLSIPDLQVLVLSASDDPAASNTRGHLFERFIAKLLADRFGFEDPTTSNLNVTSEGIELDVVAEHRLTHGVAVAECKAYSRNVPARELTSFYGKLAVERFEKPSAFGLLCALPRLTPEGEEKARAIEREDSSFRYLSADTIARELEAAGMTSGLPPGIDLSSDPAIIITEDGVFRACLLLDEVERTPIRVAVWSAQGAAVPTPTLTAVQGSEYSGGLPAVDAGSPPLANSGQPAKRHEMEPAVIAKVLGSTSDFEYQFPASPRFFVGRRDFVSRLESSIGTSGTVVFNAQSGWGKSSLALKMQSIIDAVGGHAYILDTRTADQPRYVVEVLRQAALSAAASGLLELPEDQKWASLGSSLASISKAKWLRPGSPLLVFFDQFENVFRDIGLTKEFRDLALAVRDLPGPVIVGFAWKTDLVGWTEGHPYQLRDEIRNASEVFLLEPFGANDVNVLLRRLEKAAGERLFPDLRARLRAYSQGLPWLLKKLADHILGELRAGVTQDQLLAESLNVQSLFEADLAELDLRQQEVLRHVARYAPIVASEVTERYDPESVQSLVDRRLVVQVGDRLDTYWDTFRDFLNTGRVPIQDSYILRQTPRSVARVLARVVDLGGSAAVRDLAEALDTSDNVIFNLSRELRLLGVTVHEPNRVTVLPELLEAVDPENELRRRVASALRKHRAYSTFRSLAERLGGDLTSAAYARELPSAFPAVDVAASSWNSYARAFLFWITYAGLAVQVGDTYSPNPDGSEMITLRLLEGPTAIRTRPSVPQEAPARPISILDRVTAGEVVRVAGDGDERDAIRTLVSLGAVSVGTDRVAVPSADLARLGREAALLQMLATVPGGAAGLAVLREDPAADPMTVGEAIRDAAGATWTESTTHGNGGHFRAWAKVAGMPIPRARRRRNTKHGSGSLELEAL